MSNADPLGHLGEFDLLHPIAQGGMGRVWRAVHRVSGTLSAIKTLGVGDDAEQDIFRREVRAVAQLSHANIVSLFGFGVSTAATAGLDAGTPWLAMELAVGGSLVGHTGIKSFSRLRDLCVDVLRALAHSHARGIIHRDIKPGNILIFPSPSGTTYKLTDFGIAHARGESKTTREVFASSAGTPWYMAPEQIESRWRDYGPWTDLYALGCLVWELTTGSTPYTGTQALMVARAHLQDDLPSFQPQMELPVGFEKWLRRLLEKPARNRFQRAADALHELMLLDSRGDSEPTTFEFLAPEAFETLDILQTEPTVRSTTLMEGPTVKPLLPDAATKEFSVGPPIPEDWREKGPVKQSPIGVGLELLGYREVPFVGREAERDVLWGALRECAERQKPQIVLVRGPSGGGKTSLLQWLERRAHETGAASVTWMQHGTDDSNENGLSGALQRYLGCSGLNEARARERLQLALDGLIPPQEVPYESAVLSALMFGSNVTRFSSPLERFNALLRLVKAHASARPFILLIDDAHRGYESLQLTQALAESKASAALLLVVAVNDDDFDVDEHVRAQIDALAYDAGVRDIALKRLTDREQNALVSELVNMDPKLQTKLIASSKGEPVYTIELLKTWLNSGLLTDVDGALTLTHDFEFPNDVPSILAGRFAKDPELRRALCGAALIGIVVPSEIWRPFSQAMAFGPSPLHRTDAIEPHPQGFRFASSLIRDAFVTIAQADPAVTKAHSALADIYSARPESAARQREAHHRLFSHDPAGAIEPMLDVIERFISDRRLAEAQAWVETCRAAASEAEIGQEDPRVTRLWCHRAELAYGAGQLGAALDAADEVFKRQPTQVLRAQAARLTALAYLRRAQTTEAMTWARRAVEEAHGLESPLARGHAHRTLGWITLRAGDLDESVHEMLRAADIYAEADLLEYQGLATSGASEGLRLLGRPQEAHHWLDRALSLVSPEVYRGPWGEVMIVAGVLAEEEDRIQDARMMLIQSIEALRVSGNPTQHIASTCLGLAELRFGDDSRAVSMFRETIEMTERRAPIFAYVGRMGMLYAAAISGDTQSWDRYYVELSARSTRFRLLDLARYAGHASMEWQRFGDQRRQREALELAIMLCGAWPHPAKEAFALQLEQQCAS